MWHKIAEEAYTYGRSFLADGKIADYIPELGKGDPDRLGLCIYTTSGREILIGDTETRFSMQSISKVVMLAAALQRLGFDEVFSHVLMEPSGDAFNSIMKLDTASNLPYNPMINAGAIAVAGMLEPILSFGELLEETRILCKDPDITLNESVYRSESETGDRNRAISFLLKSKGVMVGDPETSVDLYFRMCSLNVNARSLARFALILANGGVDPDTGDRLMDEYVTRTVKTLMLTCGMYDGSGAFAVRAGIPAKSGVGGGIMACAEHRAGLATFGPSLDEKGNSIGGLNVLEYLSRELHLHIFDRII